MYLDAPRVVWVSFLPVAKGPRGLTSDFASVRYRLLLPAAELECRGWDSRVTYIGSQANRRTLLARFAGADAVILGKFAAPPEQLSSAFERLMDLVQALRAEGVKILSDFCDDHFADANLGPVHRSLLHGSDGAVASTPGLAKVLREQGHSSVSVITDPVEGQQKETGVRDFGTRPASAEDPLRLLWYGHFSNLDTLIGAVPQLERFLGARPVMLTMISAGTAAKQLAIQLNLAWDHGGSGCRFIPWTPDAVFNELANCDAVVVPSNPHDPRKAIKSPNRFTEAIWAGRFVVAHPLPAYEDLAEYGWLGEDFCDGLIWHGANPVESAERIRRGQAWIRERFTPSAVAESWSVTIRRLFSAAG